MNRRGIDALNNCRGVKRREEGGEAILLTEGGYSCPPSWPLWLGLAIEFNVGTLPESVVNRRVRLARPSCECAGGGSRAPFRGGDTKPSKGESFRAVCWLRKRSSSIRSLVLFEYAMMDCYSTKYLSDLIP
jgi:hypothetical protein